jgi:transposase
MEQEKPAARRSYSAQFRAQVVEQCAAPGASVARVAISHGINTNVVHRWRRQARDAGVARGVGEFVAVSVTQPVRQVSEDIRIELRRGAMVMAITWPSTAAGECAAWMRELLR